MKMYKTLPAMIAIVAILLINPLNDLAAQNTNGADSIRQGSATQPSSQDGSGTSGNASSASEGTAGSGSNNLQGDTGRRIIDHGSIETGDTGENDDDDGGNWGLLGLLGLLGLMGLKKKQQDTDTVVHTQNRNVNTPR